MQEQHELLLERARLHAGQHENGSYEQYGHSNGHSHAGPSGEDAEEDPILLHVREAASCPHVSSTLGGAGWGPVHARIAACASADGAQRRRHAGSRWR